ncbi:Butirosin biosynthesis, BtrG-like protein [Lactarius quietus]|nr:Butirosin biosynthesis, BtrG-like protein [Lactarius quietus]
MPDDTQAEQALYFGYGSNIWVEQMNRRCPENKYFGLGVLRDWCWIINQRGFANVVPSPGDYVYGFIYEINSKDEQALDGYEGVPRDYEKKIIPLELITFPGAGEAKEKRTINALVYIDGIHISRDLPRTEYIHRINMAIKDALPKGIPQSYIDKYIRPSIPPE